MKPHRRQDLQNGVRKEGCVDSIRISRRSSARLSCVAKSIGNKSAQRPEKRCTDRRRFRTTSLLIRSLAELATALRSAQSYATNPASGEIFHILSDVQRPCCEFQTRIFRTVFMIRRSVALSRAEITGFFFSFFDAMFFSLAQLWRLPTLIFIFVPSVVVTVRRAFFC
jgi:hypothetical protein